MLQQLIMIIASWKRHLSTVIHTLFAFTSALIITACTKGVEDQRGAERTFKVALLTSGPISDQAWNGGAYQGLLRIRDSLGAKISNIETKTPAEIEENLRQYGAQGYDLVIGNGFEFQDPAIQTSPEYPRTVYLIPSGSKTGKNVASIAFAFGDGAYLAGIVAGSNTRTDTIGVIGGTQLPPVVQAFNAFEKGARSVKPGIVVLSSYVGNWDDVSAAKEQALAQITRGADIIFQNADNAGLGVFQAAKEKKNIRVFGSNSNQNGVAPDVVLGSVVIDLPHALLTIARTVKEGTFSPRVITLGGKEGIIEWVPNPKLAGEIVPATTAKVDSVLRTIRAGTFVVPQ